MTFVLFLIWLGGVPLGIAILVEDGGGDNPITSLVRIVFWPILVLALFIRIACRKSTWLPLVLCCLISCSAAANIQPQYQPAGYWVPYHRPLWVLGVPVGTWALGPVWIWVPAQPPVQQPGVQR